MKELEYNEENEIKELLFGRKVVKATDDELTLDNGIVLEVIANEGWGGCSAGWYSVTELNTVDNAITNVEFIEEEIGEGYDSETSYKIFVLAENKKIKLLQVDGDDGNGYYGTGYRINVRCKEDK